MRPDQFWFRGVPGLPKEATICQCLGRPGTSLNGPAIETRYSSQRGSDSDVGSGLMIIIARHPGRIILSQGRIARRRRRTGCGVARACGFARRLAFSRAGSSALRLSERLAHWSRDRFCEINAFFLSAFWFFSEILFEFLAGLEIRNALGWNVNRLACFGIATSTRPALACAETAEATKLDFFTFVQRAYYRVKNCFDYYFSVALVQLRSASHFFYKLCLSHRSPVCRPIRRLVSSLILELNSG